MDNFVCITCIENYHNSLDYKEWSLKSWRYWCKEHNVNLFIIDKPILSNSYIKAKWQRWNIHNYFEKEGIQYDHLAIVDLDTMINFNAPDFFNLTNGEYSAVSEDINTAWIIDNISLYQDLFPTVNLDWTDYYNAGLTIMTPKHKDLCEKLLEFYFNNKEVLTKIERITFHSDQTPMNFILKQHNYPVTKLNLKWNITHMDMRGILDNYLFLDCGWIFHFNGFDKRARNHFMQKTWDKMKERFGISN